MDMARSPRLNELKFTSNPAKTGSDGIRLLSKREASEPDLLTAWSELALRASEPNPFFEPWFLLPSLEILGPTHRINLKAFFADGVLRGIMPIIRSPLYYGYPVPHARVWLHANAFCGAPLVAKGHEQAFWRCALAHFDKMAGRAIFLHLPQMPANGAMNAALNTVLKEQGRQAVDVEQTERAMLAAETDAQTYFEASMSTKKRKELRRQRKRLGEEGVLSVERTRQADGAAAWTEEFLALEAAGWKGKEGSALASSDATRAFFSETVAQAARKGRLERLALRLDGRPIAMLANFITPPGVYSFKTTFDERYARYSPGLLLQIENLDLLERGEIKWADSCAAEGHSMIERIWREKRRLVSRNVAIGGSLRRLAFKGLLAYETRGQSPA